jgi:hypothetical protein
MVGLSAINEARVAGVMSDPTVSVPNATGAKPALTDTAEPVEEPEGDRLPLAICSLGVTDGKAPNVREGHHWSLHHHVYRQIVSNHRQLTSLK